MIYNKPDFLIVGAAKCGTTSLVYHLNHHPDIYVVPNELHFFSKKKEYGEQWYFSHFYGTGKVQGEKSPTYIYHADCHGIIKATLPDIKLIVLLRNPVERAFSNWNMRFNDNRLIKQGLNYNSKFANKIQSLDFSGIIDFYLENRNEDNIWQPPLDIIHRGLYVHQIKSLFKHFPRENILILITECFFRNQKKYYKKLFDFLNVNSIEMDYFRKIRIGDYQNIIQKDDMAKLKNFYKRYNEQLFDLLGYKIEEWH